MKLQHGPAVQTPRAPQGPPASPAYPAHWWDAVFRRDTVFVALPFVAAALWTLGFRGADPRNMGALGLLDLFTPLTVLALILLLGGFLASLHLHKPEWLLATYLVVYIALIHGTPPVLYGTLRYSWAYKHVGIVDYIMRNGSVDPGIGVGQIYHNWLGFFAGGALLTELSGQPDALSIASWAPVAFNLLNLVALRFLFRGLTRNRTVVWMALMFFLVINWVGQDYYSPQAMAYLLYLGLIGLMLRRMKRRVMVVPFAVIVAAIAVSHQITPMMMLLAVIALVALRRTPGWYLPWLAAAIIVAWALTGALSYTFPNLMDLISQFGNVVGNADQTLAKSSGQTSVGDLQVIWGGRMTVFVSGVVALIGVWRQRRTGTLILTTSTLMVLPGVLVLTTGFGGEVLFRAFLFAAPFIAFLQAQACIPRNGRGFAVRSLVAAAIITAMVLPGFLLGYYGKERQNYFTPGEVAASRWAYTHAAPHSLLVEGSTNYPGRFIDYEKFTYVSLDLEPGDSTKVWLKDPAATLAGWFSDPKYAGGYVIITRGQKIAVESGEAMPPGFLDTIEEALRRSKSFTVAYQTRDATVFAPVQRAAGR
ncbi:hypothetical protein CVV68_16450 [Arthrobacter livingstonensis]|uniref:Glycosyltransferase RgtA/B/C/D-like domain-containing protein n=1 Tax=Arthrobacter livingstonensis TaxID=670078 RepID=A0A2V5LS65_9MICC|nr:hypothetical protein [Arthrobacter livingstonensis]PYI65817.1 hypothetical protein CVV68_16450 [Arthrobacter livingstonensis]